MMKKMTNDDKIAKSNAKQAKKAAKIAKKSVAKNGSSAKTLTVVGEPAPKKSIRERVAKKLPSARKNLPKLTDDTIDEYREKILAGGRKFKYPMQTSKHKILWISLGAVASALVVFALWIYMALYHWQSTDDFYYDVARVLPLPVASVDGQSVSYGDYLRRVRADIYYYTTQENKDFADKQGQNELNYNKRKELDAAVKSAYAEKIAREKNISITDKDVDNDIKNQLKKGNIDEAALVRTLKTYYNWSMDEYREAVHSGLLLKKVQSEVKSFDSDFAKIQKENGAKELINVPKDNSFKS